MDTLPLPGFAGTCGHSTDSADKLRTAQKPSGTITVHFNNVGRNKRSWSKQFKRGITTSDIAREAKLNGGLLSSSVDAELNDNASTGFITAGFRVVGTFTVEPA